MSWRNKTRTFQTAATFADKIRNERLAAFAEAHAKENEILQWLGGQLEHYKRKILERSSVPVPATSTVNNNTSAIRSPAHKKHPLPPATNSNNTSPTQPPACKKPKTGPPSLPNEVLVSVLAMKVKQLQAELRARNKNTNGRKKELQNRLLGTIQEEEFAEEQENAGDDMDCEEEDMKQPAKEAFKPVKNEPKNEQRHSVAMVGLVEETDCMRISDSNDVKRVSVDEVEESKPVAKVVEQPLENANSLETLDGDVEMQDAIDPTQPEEMIPGPSSPEMAAKKSRSPLKRVQDGVSSAIKKFSSKKSPRKPPTKAAVVSDAIDTEGEIDRVKTSTDAVMSDKAPDAKGQNDHQIKTSMDVEMADKAPDFEKRADQKPQAFGSLSSGPSSIHRGASSTQKGGSVIKSQSVREKKDARMAKLKEMREKSKPVSSVKSFKAPTEYLATISSLKKTNAAGNEANKRRLAAEMRAKAAGNTLHQKMTVNNAKIVTAPANETAHPSTKKTHEIANDMNRPSKNPAETLASIQTNSGAKSGGSRVVNSHHKSPASTRKSPVSTHKSPASTHKSPASMQKSVRSPVQSPLSPFDTYEMSDNDDSDSSDSDDDSMASGKPTKKRIPAWALKANLYPALDKQFAPGAPDPDEIFGEVETCDLDAIFGKSKLRYKKRTSSGNWTKDRVTAAEKRAYKRTMQFGSPCRMAGAAV